METTEFVVNLLVALALGLALGIERQFGQHPAGVRTNVLVCLGAAMFVTLSRLMDHEGSQTRVAGQVVSGIGFIGGGAILRDGVNIRGMNTAATLWCSAAIGTLVGSGYPLFAALGTGAVLASHLVFRPLAHFIDVRMHNQLNLETYYLIKVQCQRADEAALRTLLLRQLAATKLRLQGLILHDGLSAERVEVVVTLHSAIRADETMNDLVTKLASEPGVSGVSWEQQR